MIIIPFRADYYYQVELAALEAALAESFQLMERLSVFLQQLPWDQ